MLTEGVGPLVFKGPQQEITTAVPGSDRIHQKPCQASTIPPPL